MPPKPIVTPVYSSNVELYSDLDSAGLTPRTPFSRKTAQLEEGRAGSRSNLKTRTVVPVNEPISEEEYEEQFDDIDLSHAQSYPLLQESMPMRSLRDDHSSSGSGQRPRPIRAGWRVFDWRKLAARIQRVPYGLLFGCGAAVVLIFLIFASIKKKGILMAYMGVNTTAIKLQTLDDESIRRFNTSTVIDYSNYSSFPLTTQQYVSECWKVVRDPRMKFYVPYWETHPGAELDVLHQKSTLTCSSTITYMLDGSVGLMADLAHIAIISAFARERNRTFFIYDKDWNRGRWTDHFLPFSETQPGPEPGCSPPPPKEMVSCPRTARHWVTSARIDFIHFGNGFDDEFEDPFKSTVERKRPLYTRSAESFSKFIRPSKLNQDLIQKTRDEVTQLALETNNNLTHYISAHIRRGDRHAMSWKYHFIPARHIPTQEYVDAVWRTYSWLTEPSIKPSHPPLIYLASDSENATTEFISTLASNDTLVQLFGDEKLYPLVYSLKTSSNKELRDLAPVQEYVQSEWDGRTKNERIGETRGVIIDWAMMSGAWRINDDAKLLFVPPQATICALPSNLCKVTVSGLGWDYAFDWQNKNVGPHPRWVEIDNGGSIIPMWTPFEIFS